MSIVSKLTYHSKSTNITPLTAGTDYIVFLHFLLAYCISAFKQVEDIKRNESAKIKKIVNLHFVKSHLKLSPYRQLISDFPGL